MDENLPLFPRYEPVNPKGVPVADPKYHKPLYKMLKMMIQKPRQIIRTKLKPRQKLKRRKFY